MQHRRSLVGCPLAALALSIILPGCLAESSRVDPAINAEYKGDYDTAKWVERFEGESREIYHQRDAILAALGPKPGERIADIGAGTGFFTMMFAERVGAGGHVFAVDIARPFLDLIRRRAGERGFAQITTVQCPPDATGLAPASVDAAFICDTYHHFEQPLATMRSLHAALRPGGRLVVIDFIREPGRSRAWVIDHVRAGQAAFAREIESVGFHRLPDTRIEGLKENYVMNFRKQ